MKTFLLYAWFIFCLVFTRVCGAQEIKDIKPPVYFPANHVFFYLLGAAACAAGLFYLIRRFLKKRGLKVESAPAPAKPAHQIAYEALDALKKKKLVERGFVKEYYFELSTIVRRYLEDRFSIRAPEMTTEEFLHVLRQSSVLAGEHKNILKQFLQHADLVKFAKYGPTKDEIDDSFLCARNLISATRAKEETELKNGIAG